MFSSPRISLLLPILILGSALTCRAASVVPGYERAILLKEESAQAEAGAVLLSELSCLACHGGAKETWKAGPDLKNAGGRLRPTYVRDFIADPARLKPGTTMPSLLAAQPEAQRTESAEDLTHYLMQLREKGPAPTAEATRGEEERGKELFYSIGCIACHSQVPLTQLAEKYAPGALAHFVQKPLTVRPAGRMPDLRVTAEETTHLEAFLAPRAAKEEPAFVPDPARVKRGEALFTSLGCISCHGATERKAIPFRAAELQGGCLAAKPPANVPRYDLSDAQREAIRAAIPHRSEPLAPVAEIRRLMLERNCFACHQRGGLGGPAEDVAVYFTSAKDDLGDLGRLPPPLDGVGRKLLLPALENIIQGQQLVRHYMRTRMPNFGSDFAEHLAPLFAAADADPKEKPTVAQENPNKVGRNEPGREIVGTSGYACIACHELHGHASLGIGAYDMAEMPKRLRPQWMRDFLINPAAFPTGTRMPAFFPNGKPMNAKLGGDAERQIDCIRVYLTEVDQSLPPEGIIDHAAFELKPAERPIVFRTFIDKVSTHAIAVGFPGGTNVVFDALNSRWALAWRGRFLDADGTWNQRVAKMEKPLGDDVVKLDGLALQSVKSDEPRVFHGYRIGQDGVPTFLYQVGKLQLEDRIEATKAGQLRRTVKLAKPGDLLPTIPIISSPPQGLQVKDKVTAGMELEEEISW